MTHPLPKTAGLWLLLSCGAPPGSVSTDRQAIFGGTADLGDPAAVQIVSGAVSCSGSLISPKIVLTAGHCISANNQSVFFMNDFFHGYVPVGISQSYTTPDYSMGFRGHDIGIIVMSDYSLQPPMTLNGEALDAGQLGASLRLIGFGETGVASQPAFAKRTVTTPITTVTANEIETATGICHGDSGGPGLLTVNGQEVIAGVISWTSNSGGACAGAVGGMTRVDVYAAWIQQQIALNDPPSCAMDGRCVQGCSPPDPDCPCVAGDLGRACNDHDACMVNATCDNAGACGGAMPKPCNRPPNECSDPTGSCYEPYGNCIYPQLPDGTACDGGACKMGFCQQGTIPDAGPGPDAGAAVDAGGSADAGVAGGLDAGNASMERDAGPTAEAPANPGARGGCGCAPGSGEPASWVLLLALVLWPVRFRR
jgi:MYXO-CTERM domain-containing protein